MGPWLTLLLASIWFIAAGFYLPCVALAAIPLCCTYRFWGLLGSLFLLAAAGALTYYEAPLQERFWVACGGMAMALSFVVTALGCEEAEEGVRRLSRESDSRLAQLSHLDERMRSELRKSQMECKELEEKIADLESRLNPLVVEEMSAYIQDLKREKSLLESALAKVQSTG